ncbi:Uncharacterised protein [Vibrio cholerae]|nr:Uncharacterised protein [Vibrio cholerae]
MGSKLWQRLMAILRPHQPSVTTRSLDMVITKSHPRSLRPRAESWRMTVSVCNRAPTLAVL